ncbi:MAG: hypothetical protein IPO52_16005 [Gemmatimonadetes bacterium]|nr:hypothetical protein [Gemmatimonadota bacterium]
MTVTVPGRHTSAWLEVRHSGRSMLVGEVMLLAGSARPIAKVEFAATTGEFRFVIPPQWNDAEGEQHLHRPRGRRFHQRDRHLWDWPAHWRSEACAPRPCAAPRPSSGGPIALLGGTTLTEWKPLGESRVSGRWRRAFSAMPRPGRTW